MSETSMPIDPLHAPEGYIAVPSIEACAQCALRNRIKECSKAPSCLPWARPDGHTVIYVKEEKPDVRESERRPPRI